MTTARSTVEIDFRQLIIKGWNLPEDPIVSVASSRPLKIVYQDEHTIRAIHGDRAADPKSYLLEVYEWDGDEDDRRGDRDKWDEACLPFEFTNGAVGPIGPQGPTGTQGSATLVSVSDFDGPEAPTGLSSFASAVCPPDHTVTGCFGTCNAVPSSRFYFVTTSQSPPSPNTPTACNQGCIRALGGSGIIQASVVALCAP